MVNQALRLSLFHCMIPWTYFHLHKKGLAQTATTILNDWIVDKKLYIAVLTETWLTGTEFDKTII